MGRLCGLYLRGTAIKELPSSICHPIGLQYLNLVDSGIKDLPCSMGPLTYLHHLDFQSCKNLTSLPSSIYGLESFNFFNLSDCSNLEVVPKITEDIKHLKTLRLEEIV